jgi:SAM-dependent methyltransferase
VPGDLSFYAGLATGGDVLEIGAGTGRVTDALAAVARSVVAIDYAPAMLQRASIRLAHHTKVCLLVADARALPVRGPFDLIALPYRVIHHVDADDRRWLWRSLGALLADDGRIAFDSWHGPPAGNRDTRSGPPVAAIRIVDAVAEITGAGLTVASMTAGFGCDHTRASLSRTWILCKRAYVQESTFTKSLTVGGTPA